MLKSISWIQQKDGSAFHIHSAHLRLFIEGIETINIKRYQWSMTVDSHYFVVAIVTVIVGGDDDGEGGGGGGGGGVCAFLLLILLV